MPNLLYWHHWQPTAETTTAISNTISYVTASSSTSTPTASASICYFYDTTPVLMMMSRLYAPVFHERIQRPAILSGIERETAEEKARNLLLSFLDAQQREMFEKERTFVMVGKSGRRFRINWGRIGNVELLQAESLVWEARYCVHPRDDQELLPTPDVMLGQMLALAHDDEATLRIANLHGRNHQINPRI